LIFFQKEDSHPYTSSWPGSSTATGMVVSGLIGSFAAASSGRNSSWPFLPSRAVVSPSTSRLRYGRTSSSTMSSRNTASGSKASFDRITQSSNASLSLLMALLQRTGRPTGDYRDLTLCLLTEFHCEPTHNCMIKVTHGFLSTFSTYFT